MATAPAPRNSAAAETRVCRAGATSAAHREVRHSSRSNLMVVKAPGDSSSMETRPWATLDSVHILDTEECW